MSVVELLKDPSVDVTLADEDGCTPLWHAAWCGNHEVIERLITSGRDLGDLNEMGRNWDYREYSALEIATQENKTEVVSVLERFMIHPARTRHELRVKLGLLDALAADLFAVIVFLCDDLLQLKPALISSSNEPAAASASRFFAIASKLPMELQMILCHRAVGSIKQNILMNDSEAAFKSLASFLI